MFSISSEEMVWGGKELSIETGKVARQADGAVVVKYGDTTVLCTCVFAKKQAENANFFPLTINYQEKFFASGRIPGGFLKREGKPGDREVLISRLIDRPIRPLFQSGFRNEVQVICTTLSYDPSCKPEIAAMIGASAAISISGLPIIAIPASCNVGYSKKSGFVLNPYYEELDDNLLELTVAGTSEGILMVESEVSELDESIMCDAVIFGFEAFQPVIKMIEALKNKVGKQVIEASCVKKSNLELFKKIEDLAITGIRDAISTKDKQLRQSKISETREIVLGQFTEDTTPKVLLEELFEEILSETMRYDLMNTKVRIDGRSPTDIRPILCEVDVLPKVHGSALFTRGETQALVVTTLGAASDRQTIDDIDVERKEEFMLHYNFPPYSVGEVGRLGAPGRREVGHGKLAWRAIHRVLPKQDIFPYTMRVVSEVTESNGSSSMATVCGTSMSLMSAGVPLRAPVAGIAMGLVKINDDYVILSDIIGDEDHLGDMDFKVAGTENGITALQMDIKITSINKNIIKAALEQAKEGRLHILSKMKTAISTSREELNSSAPRIETILIDKDRIRDLIGPGGKTIKEICEKTGVKIDIDDSGIVSVFASNKERLDIALDIIRTIGCMPDVGAVYVGTVVKIADFGAFVSIGGGREGLVHISNISDKRVNNVSDVLKVGQEVNVRVLNIDEKNRIKLTMK